MQKKLVGNAYFKARDRESADAPMYEAACNGGKRSRKPRNLLYGVPTDFRPARKSAMKKAGGGTKRRKAVHFQDAAELSSIDGYDIVAAASAIAALRFAYYIYV